MRRSIKLVNPQPKIRRNPYDMVPYSGGSRALVVYEAPKAAKPVRKKTVKPRATTISVEAPKRRRVAAAKPVEVIYVQKTATRKKPTAAKPKIGGSQVATKKPAPRKKPSTTRVKARKLRATVYKTRSGKLYAPRKVGRFPAVLRPGMKVNPGYKRRKIRTNPKFSMKSLLDTKLIMNGAAVAGGFIVGRFVSKQLQAILPPTVYATLGQFSGLINVGAGLFAATMVRDQKLKLAALGMVASGVYDIAGNFLPADIMAGARSHALGFRTVSPDYGLGADTSLLGADTSLLGSGAVMMGHDYDHEMLEEML